METRTQRQTVDAVPEASLEHQAVLTSLSESNLSLREEAVDLLLSITALRENHQKLTAREKGQADAKRQVP